MGKAVMWEGWTVVACKDRIKVGPRAPASWNFPASIITVFKFEEVGPFDEDAKASPEQCCHIVRDPGEVRRNGRAMLKIPSVLDRLGLGGFGSLPMTQPLRRPDRVPCHRSPRFLVLRPLGFLLVLLDSAPGHCRWIFPLRNPRLRPLVALLSSFLDTPARRLRRETCGILTSTDTMAMELRGCS